MAEGKPSYERLIQHFKPRSFVYVGGFFVISTLLMTTYLFGPSARTKSTSEGMSWSFTNYNYTRGNFTSWDFERDRNNFLLTQGQCEHAFPELFQDIYRVVRDRNDRRITLKDIDEVPVRNGYVRGMIYNQQLYVIKTEGSIYSRGIATLLAMNRAITTSPEPIPNLEFTFSADDWLPPTPQWAYARKEADTQTWLMPDFGYWSWPETKAGSYGEILDKALEMEQTSDNPTGKAWGWHEKIPKILWRGAIMDMPLRQKLIDVSKDKEWADVKSLNWHDKQSTSTDLKSMAEHCQHKFLVNTAGNSYSGRLKYIQNCRSVIFMHEDEWVTHHTHLMKSEGENQNFVLVDREFAKLEPMIENLIADDANAERIAENNVRMFRERYLTPAAETCYWRRLFHAWAAISFEPDFYQVVDGKKIWRGLPVESYVLEKKMEWDPY